MTQPMEKARRRPMMLPILPPGIIRQAITSVYRVMAVWMPVTDVPTSSATVAMETFITELSSAMMNWPVASTKRTKPADAAATALAPCWLIVAPPPVAPDVGSSAISPSSSDSRQEDPSLLNGPGDAMHGPGHRGQAERPNSLRTSRSGIASQMATSR